MTTLDQSAPASGSVRATATDHVTVISIDSHLGPPLAVLREYCSEKYLEDFDDFTKEFEGGDQGLVGIDPTVWLTDDFLERMVETLTTPLMHYDPHERLKDMDADGIAAEVMYHGTHNGHPIPMTFAPRDAEKKMDDLFGRSHPKDAWSAERQAEGLRIYNRWLADYISAAPDRLCGVLQMPFWDIDASVGVLEDARNAGIRAVNLPAPHRGLLGYNHSDWDRLWSACVDLGMSVNCHGGSAVTDTDDVQGGANAGAIMGHEITYWSRRVLWHMILGGVFDRHPELIMVMTEQAGGWLDTALKELDGLADTSVFRRPALERAPSTYFKTNCFIGASYMSRGEVKAAKEAGLLDRTLWGSDYPHPEGTFPHSKESLRMALEDLDSESDIRGLLGVNAAPVYGFDLDVLRPIAERIGPTLSELRIPLPDDEVPRVPGSGGFRRGDGWA